MPIGNPVTLTSNVASKTISVTATASQTLFNVTGGYRINELGVFKNGLRLQDGVDYTARDGLTVTLLSAASGGDKLQFVVFDTFRVAEAIRPNVDEQTIRGNLNVVGILSASTLEGLSNFNLTSGITTFNDVRVGGALTVAGALTFEDVTNVDAVGYSTFREGINVQGAGSTTTTLNVTGVATVGSNISIGDSIFHTGDGGGTTFGFPAADTFTVYTAGSERIRVTSAGNFGVGTTPEEIFHVKASSETVSSRDGVLFESSSSLAADTGLPLVFTSHIGNAANYGVASIAGRKENATSGNGAGYLQFGTGSGAGAIAEKMRITSGGNVGINTTIPESLLEIMGDSTVGDATITFNRAPTASNDGVIGQLFFQNNTDSVALISANRESAADDAYILFATQATGGGVTERLRIDSNGKVGINSTSPGDYLSIDGDMGLYRSGTQHGTYYIYKDNVATAWFKYRGNSNDVVIGNNAGDKLTINPSGDVNITGITTATQLFEGTTRVATSGKAIAMALIFG